MNKREFSRLDDLGDDGSLRHPYPLPIAQGPSLLTSRSEFGLHGLCEVTDVCTNVTS